MGQMETKTLNCSEAQEVPQLFAWASRAQQLAWCADPPGTPEDDSALGSAKLTRTTHFFLWLNHVPCRSRVSFYSVFVWAQLKPGVATAASARSQVLEHEDHSSMLLSNSRKENHVGLIQR